MSEAQWHGNEAYDPEWSDNMSEKDLAHIEGFWIDDDGNWIPEDDDDEYWYGPDSYDFIDDDEEDDEEM